MTKSKRLILGSAALGLAIAVALGLAPAEAANGLANGLRSVVVSRANGL